MACVKPSSISDICVSLPSLIGSSNSGIVCSLLKVKVRLGAVKRTISNHAFCFHKSRNCCKIFWPILKIVASWIFDNCVFNVSGSVKAFSLGHVLRVLFILNSKTIQGSSAPRLFKLTSSTSIQSRNLCGVAENSASRRAAGDALSTRVRIAAEFCFCRMEYKGVL